MFSPSPRLPRALSLPRPAAFTLIELLVVIAIIAVLAGLLLPVVNKVTENARKVSAHATETQIVSAVNSYQTDYGQYPVVPPAGAAAGTTPKDTTFDGSSGNTNSVLLNVLRGLNASDATTGTAGANLNARRTVYFEGKNVKNATLPRDGFILTANGQSPDGKSTYVVGDMVDPWGNEYKVRIDTGYTNAVKNPYSDATTNANDDGTEGPTDTSILHLGVIAYSYGADGKVGLGGVTPTTPFSNIGDDVISWQ